MKRHIACVVLALAGAALVEAHVACVNALPSAVCAPSEIQALPASPDTEITASQNDCISCLDTPCCDAIGKCDDKCRKKVRDAHACILAKGRYHEAEGERRCLDDNDIEEVPDASTPQRDAYLCMRDKCGDRCGLPSCVVDRSWGLFIDSSCDNCLSHSCCPEVNACAANRGCKLVTDCIVRNCKSLYGGVTTSLTPAIIAEQKAAVCSNQPTPPIGKDPTPQCVRDCIFQEQTEDVSPTSGEGPSAGCLGIGIVACAVRAGCTTACAGADAGAADAGKD